MAVRTDLSIWDKFDFEMPPVGVKFLYTKPEDIAPLEKTLSICEMIKEAQQAEKPFYFGKEQEDCFGKVVMGMVEAPSFAESGQVGLELEIFQEPRANTRIYQHIQKLPKGTVNYVAFSRLDQLTFDPDLLIIMAPPSQAEIILRAWTYSTGDMWDPKGTSVLGCAWIFSYPYITGKINYTITGLAFGSKSKQVFPEGKLLISIPYNWIPTITRNLEEMKWVLPGYTDGRENFKKRESQIMEKLAKVSETI